jgi:hypothetical protein
MESFTVASCRKLMDAAAESISPCPGSASTIAAILDCLRLVGFILASIGAGKDFLALSSREGRQGDQYHSSE